MKFLDKYKLYRNIMKQKPICVIVHNNKYMIYDTDDYKVDIYSIKKSDFVYIKPRFWKTKYFASVKEKNKKSVIKFDGLMAKKLFEYGKQNQK
ncbi:MAG: hypothetical protein J5620_03020 [Alphaproteobacteria bacterium]|nr:hypothetical protein [Alphaproteobacteria bacterium]